MVGLRGSLSALQKLRGLFQKRIGAAAAAGPARPDHASPLREISGFGSNPGNLRMFAHVPAHIAPKPALVVALHGCTQSASAYALGSGWSDVGDQQGFVVIYPEQQSSNNPKSCFSWFLPADTGRGSGEALSIRQMIENAVSEFDIDENRIFITGLSAGGAMASVMLATYPELFAGGAIIGGLPYGVASNVQEALDAMFNDRAPSGRALGDRVRAASNYRGPWPRISVWHGTADAIVKPSNAEHVVSQWLNVQGLQREPSQLEQGAGYTRRMWANKDDKSALECFTVTGMGHGVPLATTGQDACGAVGPFFLDTGISATSHIARFWDLESTTYTLPKEAHAGAADSAPARYASGPRAQSANAEADADPALTMRPSFNPNEVIAAAFKAAGLSPLDTRGGTAGSKVDPTAVIAAALRAAGLSRP